MHEMFYVYILKSLKSGKFYIGSTNNLQKRLSEHNTDKRVKLYTYRYRPWKLFMYREFEDEQMARQYEKVVKSYKGGSKFKKIVNGEVAEWSKAAGC